MKIYFFDIDGTICDTNDGNYAHALPYRDRIEEVNNLYDEGHKIIMWTARGAQTGINWIPLTISQLKAWGVKYHELRPKPYWDFLVDDKAHNAKDFFN